MRVCSTLLFIVYVFICTWQVNFKCLQDLIVKLLNHGGDHYNFDLVSITTDTVMHKTVNQTHIDYFIRGLHF